VRDFGLYLPRLLHHSTVPVIHLGDRGAIRLF
jgi:hypothetical protein